MAAKQRFYKWGRLKELFAGSRYSDDTPEIEDATYEELFSPVFKQSDACTEVVRRLERLLYSMAFAKTGERSKADSLVEVLVREIAYQFPAGSGDDGLRRLAVVIRGVIGESAFQAGLPRLYYTQIPLYHLRPAEREDARTLLEQPERQAQNRSSVKELAAGRNVTPERLKESLRGAKRELVKVMHNDFETERLQTITEGYLPWGDPEKRD